MRDIPLARWLRVEPFVVKPPVTDVEIEHQPRVWVRARVDRMWWFHGAWKVAVYYYDFVSGLQFFRVYSADRCRPAP